MLIVDPNHWLTDKGLLPGHDTRLPNRIHRVVQFIEAGGSLPRLHARETVIPGKRRPKRKPCTRLMWIVKAADVRIHSYCPASREDEVSDLQLAGHAVGGGADGAGAARRAGTDEPVELNMKPLFTIHAVQANQCQKSS